MTTSIILIIVLSLSIIMKNTSTETVSSLGWHSLATLTLFSELQTTLGHEAGFIYRTDKIDVKVLVGVLKHHTNKDIPLSQHITTPMSLIKT